MHLVNSHNKTCFWNFFQYGDDGAGEPSDTVPRGIQTVSTIVLFLESRVCLSPLSLFLPFLSDPLSLPLSLLSPHNFVCMPRIVLYALIGFLLTVLATGSFHCNRYVRDARKCAVYFVLLATNGLATEVTAYISSAIGAIHATPGAGEYLFLSFFSLFSPLSLLSLLSSLSLLSLLSFFSSLFLPLSLSHSISVFPFFLCDCLSLSHPNVVCVF